MSSPRSLVFDTKSMRQSEDEMRSKTTNTMLALIRRLEKEEAGSPSTFVLELRPLLEAFLSASFVYIRELELTIKDQEKFIDEVERKEFEAWEKAAMEDGLDELGD